MVLRLIRAVVLISLTGAAPSLAADAGSAPLPDRIQFNRDIRPILSDNCFACHGFDQAERKADLRLDVKEALTAPLDDGRAVTPGKPEESLLYARVVTDDPGDLMPPPKSNKKLSARQKALLKRWIEQGAEWEEHWSYTPVVRPELPPAARDGWVRNPVDAFVLERLKKEGLKPSPEADKAALIRRVTLDLTGLPPTIEEVDAFLADDSPDAYERVVDRLLSGVRYGERMALEWLDVARFADTHGYHIDSGRDMTRWREWVIEAFHKNMPYDRFTVEQLAGDLLPNVTLEQKIASGFNRNHMVNFEGGAIAEEYRTAYVVDRVNTTATVWLGLTVACAQCHDHKYDPVSQKEYFQLFAFFNNITEQGLDGRKGNAVPYLPTPNADQRAKLRELTARAAELERQLTEANPEADAAQVAWEASLATAVGEGIARWVPADALELASEGKAVLKQRPDKSIVATGENAARDVYTVTLAVPPGLKDVTGVRLEALPDESLVAGGPGRSVNGNIVMTEFRVAALRGGAAGGDGAAPTPAPVKLADAQATFSQQDFPVINAIDRKAATGWAIFPEVGKAHEAVFTFDRPLGVDTAPAAGSPDAGRNPPGVRLVVTLEFKSQFGRHQLGRFRLSLTDSPSPAAAAGKLPADLAAVLALPPERRTDAQQARLRQHFRTAVWPGGKKLAGRIAEAKKVRDEFEQTIPTTMVMQEMDKPRDTHVLMRGEYDKPGEKVSPGVPAFLPPLPDGEPANRLGLARWLVDRRHPLTSRVTVNRYWQMIFGTGLVKTSDDFGFQGELPSHPELLDWLSAEFMETGWDVRRLIRLYVTSATYRQSSAVAPELLAKDPENRLLARGARYRLQAEMIRDQALAAGGLLDPRVGGASVSPYQPPGLWEELMSRGDGAKWSAQVYVQSKGADLYRRTMYTFWKRTSPPPTLSTFDAPDRETCTVRRGRTNTPLQALVLMNDPTYVEAARKLAERALKDPPADAKDEDRISFAFRTVLARKPADREVAVLKVVLEKQRAKFAADKSAAEKLLKVGESPADGELKPAELAAWATVCSVILNLDEAVTRG